MFHGTLSHSFAQAIPVTDAKDLESTVTLIDLGGTASDIDLISIPIILKDDEFAQFIQTLNTDKDRNRTWGEFFKKYGDPKDLEDFMADREQDVPKDRFQAHSLRHFQFLMSWLMFVCRLRKVA